VSITTGSELAANLYHLREVVNLCSRRRRVLYNHEKHLLEDFRITYRGINFFAIPVEPTVIKPPEVKTEILHFQSTFARMVCNFVIIPVQH
jgi:hypothetical protein